VPKPGADRRKRGAFDISPTSLRKGLIWSVVLETALSSSSLSRMCLRRRAEVDSGSSSSSCSESCSTDGEDGEAKEESGICCGPIWGSVGEGRRPVVDLDLGGICSYEIIVARCVPRHSQEMAHTWAPWGCELRQKRGDRSALFGIPRTSCVERECHQREARSSSPGFPAAGQTGQDY